MDLFTFLVDDLEDELAQAGIRRVQFCLNGEQYQTRNLDFADDVVLLIEHEEEIQPALDTIQSFYLKRRLYPIPTKCDIINFDPKKRALKTTPSLLGKPLPKVQQLTYLGQFFSDDAKFSAHIKKATKEGGDLEMESIERLPPTW